MRQEERQRENQEDDELYERYGKPLEDEHWGEFIAITRDGRTLLAPSLEEAMDRSYEAFGPGSFIFQIGPRVVGRWR